MSLRPAFIVIVVDGWNGDTQVGEITLSRLFSDWTQKLIFII